MIKSMINLLSLLLSSVLWVQVPQWSDDWSKCAVDIPDASCHWYITAPDNTFGKGFDWASAPWFDANGLSDVPSIDKQTAIEKLQSKYCLLYTSPSPRDMWTSRMPSSA